MDFGFYISQTYFLHMTSARDFFLSDFTSGTIWLKTLSEFLNSVHMTSKLSILSNHAEYLKETSVVLLTTSFYSILAY